MSLVKISIISSNDQGVHELAQIYEIKPKFKKTGTPLSTLTGWLGGGGFAGTSTFGSNFFIFMEFILIGRILGRTNPESTHTDK